jgi:hypothetical protein
MRCAITSNLRRSQSSEILDHAIGVTALHLTHYPAPKIVFFFFLFVKAFHFVLRTSNFVLDLFTLFY